MCRLASPRFHLLHFPYLCDPFKSVNCWDLVEVGPSCPWDMLSSTDFSVIQVESLIPVLYVVVKQNVPLLFSYTSEIRT